MQNFYEEFHELNFVCRPIIITTYTRNSADSAAIHKNTLVLVAVLLISVLIRPNIIIFKIQCGLYYKNENSVWSLGDITTYMNNTKNIHMKRNGSKNSIDLLLFLHRHSFSTV